MAKKKLLFLILILATLLRFIGLTPNVAHPDEGPVQVYSQELLLNILTKGDFNPHTFKYGSLIYYLHAIAYLPIISLSYLFEVANTLISSSFASQPLAFTVFFYEGVSKYGDTLLSVGRAITAGFGVASVYLLYLIGKRLFGKYVGLIAAFFLAISPLHVRDSHYITTDVPFLFFVLLSLFFLIRLAESGKRKWYILSGLFIGLSVTIRYFPIAALAYPVAALLDFKKERAWLGKVLIGLTFIFIGLFIGVPYLFLDPQGPELFVGDLEKYALPWYSTSISIYVFSLISFLANGGRGTLPSITSLYPGSFTPFFASYGFFNGLGMVVTIFALIGFLIAFYKFPKKTLLLTVIPLATFIYTSFYLRARYERLIIPVLPFLALFAAVSIRSLDSRLNKHLGKLKGKVAFIFLLVLVVYSPLSKSVSLSLACSQKTTQHQSIEWVRENIPPEAKIAFLPMVSFPSETVFSVLYQLDPDKELSLEEVRRAGYNYAFLNAGRLDYVTYAYFNDFFVPPAPLYENHFYSLVLAEYASRANLLGEKSKPVMCDSARILYYKLPEPLPEPKNNLRNVNFTRKEVTKYGWSIVRSDKISIQSEAVYKFSALIKSSKSGQSAKVVLRMDFYNQEKNESKLDELVLLQKYGASPAFFEAKRRQSQNYGDPQLPGKLVALSPRKEVGNSGKRITVTAKAPGDARYAILSILNLSAYQSTIYVDNVDFLGGNETN